MDSAAGSVAKASGDTRPNASRTRAREVTNTCPAGEPLGSQPCSTSSTCGSSALSNTNSQRRSGLLSSQRRAARIAPSASPASCGSPNRAAICAYSVRSSSSLAALIQNTAS